MIRTLVKTSLERLGFRISRVKRETAAGPEADAFVTMRHLVTKGAPEIFDVGANVGQTARHFRALFPAARIHCFEPFAASCRQLRDETRGDPGIVANEIALSDSVGTARLSQNRCLPTNSLLRSDPRASKYWGEEVLDTEGEVVVATTSVDEFCRENAVEHVDILKLDVQGGEYAVLEGARAMLSRQAIDLIYMEMIMAPTYLGQRKLHDYLSLLDSLGYELLDFYNPVRRAGRLIQTDNILLSSRFLDYYELAGSES